MKDQVEELTRLGLRAFAISPLSRRHATTIGHFCSERRLILVVLFQANTGSSAKSIPLSGFSSNAFGPWRIHIPTDLGLPDLQTAARKQIKCGHSSQSCVGDWDL